ncbi:cell division protein FtsL [Ferrovum sp.]|jgi:cell division protein FtsL|uniref:cell division protein FtsL n=1 Tax=Ferrovum sp. TaxID=2609467 RepID=UPI0026359B82|nr:cell division protein FtsL [Ferrovum sp.]
MTRRDGLLFLLVLSLALGVIQSQQETRRLYIDLQQEKDHQVQLQTEGDQLQIEEGTLSASHRIEAHALHELGMQLPTPAQKHLLVVAPLSGEETR